MSNTTEGRPKKDNLEDFELEELVEYESNMNYIQVSIRATIDFQSMEVSEGGKVPEGGEHEKMKRVLLHHCKRDLKEDIYPMLYWMSRHRRAWEKDNT